MNSTPFADGVLSPDERQLAFNLWRDLHAHEPGTLERLAEAPIIVRAALGSVPRADKEPEAGPNPFR